MLESSFVLARMLDNLMSEGEHGRRPFLNKRCHSPSPVPFVSASKQSGALQHPPPPRAGHLELKEASGSFVKFYARST